MSVPLSVFEAAGYTDADAKKAKRKFDEQEVSLQHLANGDVTQDMLRDEFGIGQLGKRLKLLEAAKALNAKAPKTKRRAPPADPVPEPNKDVALRQRKGKQPARAKPVVGSDAKPKRVVADRRSMKQKIMDPKTVAEINELRGLSEQMSDWCSRTLGGARDAVAVGSILLSLAYWGATAMNVLPPGMSLLP